MKPTAYSQPAAMPEVPGHVAEELVRVELAAQPVQVGAVLAQRRDARLDGGRDVHVVRGVGGRPRPTSARCRPTPGPPPGNTHALAASRQASSTASPTRTMVGVVDHVAVAPGQVEVHGDHDVRALGAQDRGQVAAQRQAVLHQPVRVVQEMHLADADHRGAAALLLHPERPDLFRVLPGDPGFPAGGQQVGDMLALAGPAGDRGRRAVFQVVRVSDHRHRALPVLRHRLHGTLPVSSGLRRPGRS